MSSSSLATVGQLGLVFAQHRSQLLAMVERRLDGPGRQGLDAEGIVQEAFLRAQQKYADYLARPERPSPYVWLYGLTRDVLCEAWRKLHTKGRDADRELPWPDRSSVQLAYGLVGHGTSPTGKAMRAELQACMQQTLALMRPAERDVLWMRHADQLTFGDLSVVLGITENAATVRYFRALRKLKNLWQQLHGDKGFEL